MQSIPQKSVYSQCSMTVGSNEASRQQRISNAANVVLEDFVDVEAEFHLGLLNNSLSLIGCGESFRWMFIARKFCVFERHYCTTLFSKFWKQRKNLFRCLLRGVCFVLLQMFIEAQLRDEMRRRKVTELWHHWYHSREKIVEVSYVREINLKLTLFRVGSKCFPYSERWLGNFNLMFNWQFFHKSISESLALVKLSGLISRSECFQWSIRGTRKVNRVSHGLSRYLVNLNFGGGRKVPEKST